MMINRILSPKIEKRLFGRKAILLFGARQTGKSTLMENILSIQHKDFLILNGDDSDVRELLSNASASKLRNILGKKEILLIDEAQRIENIGLTLKIITDQLKNIQVLATGSSSFELSGKVNESLTGRKYQYMLYPLSFEEMVNHHGLLEEKRLIEQRLVFGYYPEIVTHPSEEKERLQLLADSYLYKDLLMLEQIKKPALLEKLLRALALQIGNEVNLNEVGQLIGSDRKTVEKYINLLEKAFVIFQLPAFSKNVRNEIRKGKKVYFFDCGIRNAIINNFNPVSGRQDLGSLWENFIIAERMKYLNNTGQQANLFFWRTTQQQEIDLIEEKNGKLTAMEIKWNKSVKIKIPKTFTGNYSEAEAMLISPENMENILLS